MNDKLKVLSIDWDYFVAATAVERMSLFPDGGNENLPPMLRSIVWSSHYAYTDDLSKVGVMDEVNSAVDDLMESIQRHVPVAVWVSDSHAPAYQVIMDALENTGKSSVDLVNIDFHHDVYGSQVGDLVDDVNCGNWLRALDLVLGGKDNSYLWVGHKDSDMADWECFGSENGSAEFTTSLNDVDIADTDWDVVFLCRSDMWSPPHLDFDFAEAALHIIDAVDDNIPVMGQSYVLKSRMEDLEGLIEQERDIREKCARG